jgi:hypothetical protein
VAAKPTANDSADVRVGARKKTAALARRVLRLMIKADDARFNDRAAHFA